MEAGLTDRRGRRKYEPGRCGDCGWERAVTLIRFWVNDYRMHVCAECIRPYRGRILR
jgi:hypothetical protein